MNTFRNATLLAALIGAAPASAGDVSVRQLRGDGVSWYTNVAEGCLQTYVFLRAEEEIVQDTDVAGAPVYGTELSYSSGTFDVCTFRSIRSESGATTAAIVDIDNGTGVISGTVTVRDFMTGASRDLPIALTLTGVGAVTHSVLHIVDVQDDTTYVDRGTGTSESALVSGSIGDLVFDGVAGATLIGWTEADQVRSAP